MLGTEITSKYQFHNCWPSHSSYFFGNQAFSISVQRNLTRQNYSFECQTAPQTAVFHRRLSEDCPNCRYPRKVSALGFFVCSHWKCLSCRPDSSAVFLFNLSLIVSSTHRDTDRLGNSSSWSSSEVGRLRHLGVLRSVNSIWISPMWIVTYSRIYFINRSAWLQVRSNVTNWALANRRIFISPLLVNSKTNILLKNH